MALVGDGANGIKTTVYYPGVVAVVGGVMTWGHGETPGICQLTIAPQLKAPATFGTLRISYGNVAIEFENCRLVASSMIRNSTGQIVELTIQDWRWEWQDRGFLNVRYNLRDSDGKVVTRWERSPQAIAREAFEAIGQAKFGVDQLPDFPRPLVDAQFENPARLVSGLAESLGCRLAPKFGNAVEIVRLGEGLPLPDGPDFPIVELNEGLDPPEKPGAIMVVQGPTEFENDFELEAVALESSGEYVPLDDVSYRPASGWSYDATENFEGVGEADSESRRLAKQSVYRSFRIKIPAGGLTIPGYTQATNGDKVDRMDRLVILDRQCHQVTQLGKKEFLPTMLYGEFEGDNGLENKTYGNTFDEPRPITDLNSDLAKRTIYRLGHTVDTEKGIVHASTRLLLLDPTSKLTGPAKLRLRVAVCVRDAETGGIKRQTRTRTYPGEGRSTIPKVLRHDEIVTYVIPKYAESNPLNTAQGASFDPPEAETNTPETDKESDYYLDIEEKTYQTLRPADAVYGGIIPYSPDGVIHHIVWSWGNGGNTLTRIGYNCELAQFITPYKQRRLNSTVQSVVGQKGVAAQ